MVHMRYMKNVLGMLIVAGSGWAIASPQNCYFLESSNCGSGQTFCTENKIVCDVGYQTSDAGCGKMGPLSIPGEDRHCWRLIGVLTVACNEASPSGFESTACAESGVCCYAQGRVQQSTGVNGKMSAPSGAACHCETEVQQ